jgi:GNAT superfamily N-acetyltransferase
LGVEPADISIVPANQASWADLAAVFGKTGYPARCFCQKLKLSGRDWHYRRFPVEELAFRLREQTDCGHPDSDQTSGLVAYVGGEPAGWCSVEPRSEFIRLGQTPWKGRYEEPSESSVWAISCFVTRVGFRRQGLTRTLARAAAEFARERGAAAIEGYPMDVPAGEEITWGENHVGSRSVFAAAGFTEVSRPSKRRVVMRIDF